MTRRLVGSKLRQRLAACAAPAALILALAASPALAQDDEEEFQGVEIDDDLETPIDTATIDNGAPANILLEDRGSITFDAEVGDNDPRNTEFDGLAAVTLNSSNSFTNEGDIIITDALPDENGNPVVGIRADTDAINGPTFILNDGVIRVNETYERDDDGVTGLDINGDGVLDDADIIADDVNDDDDDGPVAEGFGRFGILIEGDAAFQGDLLSTSGSLIQVEGNRSAAIRVESDIDGDVRLDGRASVVGNESVALDLQGGVSGDLTLRSSFTATGEDSAGVRVAGDIGGNFNQGANITATGFTSQGATNYFDPDDIDDDDDIPERDPDDLLDGAPALRLAGNIDGGFLNSGPIARAAVDDPDDDTEDDPNTPEDETDDEKDLNAEFNENRPSGNIRSVGSAPALLIQPLSVGEALDPNDADSPVGGTGDLVIGGVEYEVIIDTTDDNEDDETDDLRAIVAVETMTDAEILALAEKNGITATSLADLEEQGVDVFRVSQDDVYSVINRGTIAADGQNLGFTALALDIRGSDDGQRDVQLSEGLLNSGTISADAFEANATAVRIGDGANVPRFDNTGTIRSTVFAEPDRTPDALAVAVLIEDGADVPSLLNRGSINATMRGDHGDTIAIRDNSGTLVDLRNQGSISASFRFDGDDDDGDGDDEDTNTEPDDETGLAERTGDTVAVDLSANTVGATLTQELRPVYEQDENGNIILDENGDPVVIINEFDGFAEIQDINDDDVIDEDDVSNPSIVGDVKFGSGDDTFDLLAGSVRGDVYFGDGEDVFRIDGTTNFGGNDDPSFVGDINDDDGLLRLIIGSATVEVTNPDGVNLTSLDIRDDTSLRVVIDIEDESSGAEYQVSETASISTGVEITPEFVGLSRSGETVVIDADSLTVEEDLETLLSDESPFLYNVTLSERSEGGRDQLVLRFEIRTPDELGLDTNESKAFDAIINAAAQDEDASTALANIASGDGFRPEADFEDAYGQLMMDYSRGSMEVLLAASDAATGAVSNRLEALHASRDAEGGVWVQEFAFFTDAAANEVAPGYTAEGFGLAQGFDIPAGPLYALGVNWAFTTADYNQDSANNSATSVTILQLGAYAATSLGPVLVDTQAGIGVGSYESSRLINFGDAGTAEFDEEASANWRSYMADGSVRISAPVYIGNFYFSPSVSATYLYVEEEGYKESGAGTLNYVVAPRKFDSFTAAALANFGWRFNNRSGSWWSPRFRFGYGYEEQSGVTKTSLGFVDDDGVRTDNQRYRLDAGDLPEPGFLSGFTFAAGSAYSAVSFDVDTDMRDGYTRTTGRITLRFLF